MRKILIPVCLFLIVISFMGCDSGVLGELVSSGQVELHHLFPNQFRDDFARAGLNVDDFTIALSKESHRGAGKGLQYIPTNWNEEWRKFLIENPNPTQRQLYNKAEQMLSNAGGRGEFNFYNYGTKLRSTGSLAGSSALTCMGNIKFWRFFGTIGNWLIQRFGGYKFGAILISFLASIGSIVLGFFGIKVEHPVAVGVGLIVCIIGIIVLVGLIYLTYLLVTWFITVALPAIIVLGKIVLNVVFD